MRRSDRRRVADVPRSDDKRHDRTEAAEDIGRAETANQIVRRLDAVFQRYNCRFGAQ